LFSLNYSRYFRDDLHLRRRDTVSAKKEWPDWTPPQMLRREPDLMNRLSAD
jgi:lipoprotein-anchoring transpeptidase ErfK/SrfK